MPLTPGAGALGEAVCGRCGGRLLDEAAVQRLIIEEHGIARDTLRELAGNFGRPTLRCAGCGQRMHPVRLRGVPLELCTGCGGVWLDAGELGRLSEGRWAEVAGPAPPPDEHALPPPLAAPAVGCSVLLDDDRPEVERVVAAYGRARFRTAQDARAAAQRGHGVVADRVSAEDAQRLHAALAAEGLPARVLDATLLELPAAVRSKQLTVDDAGVALADALGRPITVPWRWLRALGCGLVRVAEAETQLVSPEPGEASPYGSQASSSLPAPQRVRTVIVDKDEVVVDLVMEDDERRRARFRVTRSGVILRHRAGQTRDAAFRDLVAELVRRAPPETVRARGARAIERGDDGWQRYRAVRDFELALRWAMARTLVAPGGTS